MNLIALRREKKLKSYQIAQQLGVTPQVYSRYERNEREPSLAMLEKLADVFGVTVDELLGRTAPGQLFDDARVPKPYYQRLYEALSLVDRGRVEGYMERLIEEAGGNISQIKAASL